MSEYKLNADGWLLAVAASLVMFVASCLCIYGYGLNWQAGLFAGISALCLAVTYANYRKEIK